MASASRSWGTICSAECLIRFIEGLQDSAVVQGTLIIGGSGFWGKAALIQLPHKDAELGTLQAVERRAKMSRTSIRRPSC